MTSLYKTHFSRPVRTESHAWAEVQEALKLRPRVHVELHSTSASSADKSLNPYTLTSTRPKVPSPDELRQNSALEDKEILDFSPSVGIRPLHPIPLSSNDGTTLDWSGEHADEERQDKRWSIPLHRKVSREKLPPRKASATETVEKQESLYAGI